MGTYTIKVQNDLGNALSEALVSYKISSSAQEQIFGTTGSGGTTSRTIVAEPIYVSAAATGYVGSGWSTVYPGGTYIITLYEQFTTYLVSRGTTTNCGVTFSTSADGPWYTGITVGEFGTCYAKVTPATGYTYSSCSKTGTCAVIRLDDVSGSAMFQLYNIRSSVTFSATCTGSGPTPTTFHSISIGRETYCTIELGSSPTGDFEHASIFIQEGNVAYAKVTPNTGYTVSFCWGLPINSCIVTLYSSSSGYNIYQISSVTEDTAIHATAMERVEGVRVKSDGAWVQAQYYEKINGEWMPSTNWSSIYSKLNSGEIIKCPKPSNYPHEYYTINEDNCTNCNACSSVCGLGAIYQGPGKYRIDPYLCNCCGDCYDVGCPGSAISYVEETDD